MQKHITCFLVDNDTDDQEIFKMALREIDSSISCIVADDGVTAIEQLRTNTAFIPSFIFLDMNMPLMNGKQCLKEIRKMPWLNAVPVYIYSTATNAHYVEETKMQGLRIL
jgi:CheY-like chemotaxis protein